MVAKYALLCTFVWEVVVPIVLIGARPVTSYARWKFSRLACTREKSRADYFATCSSIRLLRNLYNMPAQYKYFMELLVFGRRTTTVALL